MKLNSLFKIILPLLILALAVGSFYFLKSNKSERKKPQSSEKVWQVTTINARIDNIAADLTLYASIESPSLHSASAPAPAIVEKTFVKSGSHVKQGDVLLKLEQQDFINSVNQVKADVLDIKAQILQLNLKHESNNKALVLEKNLLELSQSDLNRVLSLKKRGLGSDSALSEAKSALAKQKLSLLNRDNDVIQYKAKKQQLNAKLMRLNASLNQANLALNRSIIRAKFDGVVSSIDVSQGDRVKSAQKLISLYPSQQLEAKTLIPSRFQQEIQLMLSNKQVIEATANIANKQITMQLDRIAGHAATNGTEVYFRITQGQDVLRVGNFLKLNVKRTKQSNVIKLPLQALYGTSRIYLIKDHRLKGLNIETAGHFKDSSGAQHILIRHPDIQEGDEIVTTHLPNAITGLKVKTSEK